MRLPYQRCVLSTAIHLLLVEEVQIVGCPRLLGAVSNLSTPPVPVQVVIDKNTKRRVAIKLKKCPNIFRGDLLARPATMPSSLRSLEGVMELIDIQRDELVVIESLPKPGSLVDLMRTPAGRDLRDTLDDARPIT
jgi:hypothetical protein